MIHVVLGMHKSGTSLVSEILHASGVHMVEPDAPASGRRFTHERASTRELNKQILADRSAHSLDVLLRAPLQVDGPLRRRMRAIVEACSERHQDWGFKDPRTCMTYPAWADVLGEHRLVVVFRTLHDVVAHYRPRLNPVRAWKAMRAWTHYNRHIVDHLAAAKVPSIVLSYDALMTDDAELRRFSAFVGKPLVDRRRAEHHHHRTPSSRWDLLTPLLPENPRRLLAELHGWQAAGGAR